MSRVRRHHGRLRDQRGAQMVDFALWVPIVVLLAVTALQLCLDVLAQRRADQAVDAAVAALAAGEPVADVRDRVGRVLAPEGTLVISGGTVLATVEPRRVAPWLPGQLRTSSGTAPAGAPGTVAP